MNSEIQLMMDMDLVRGGAPGAATPGVFEIFTILGPQILKNSKFFIKKYGE